MKVKSRISSSELFFVMIQSMIGVGILSLPYQLYKAAEQDGWISIIITVLVINVILLTLWFLCKRFPHQSLFHFSKIIVGEFLGNTVNILYVLYLLTIASYVFIVFTDIINRWILPETPKWIWFLIVIVIIIYGCLGTVRSTVALFSFLFVFTLLLLFIPLLILPTAAVDIRYMFPVGASGGETIFKAIKEAFPSFIGFETFLFYFAFIKNPKKLSAMKGPISAILFTAFYYLIIFIICIISFSPKEMGFIPEPVLFVLRTVEIYVLGRFDLIFIICWSMVVATTLISYSFLASMGIHTLTNVKHKKSVLLSAIIFILISLLLYNKDITESELLINQLNFVFGIIIPIILLLIAVIFKRKEDHRP